jgi:hypothetical protein
MTSFITSLWRWLLSWLKRHAGSNGALRVFWGFLQRLLSSIVRRRADASSGACGSIPSKGSAQFVRPSGPSEHCSQSGYTVIFASHDFARSESYLSTAPSTTLGYQDSLQVIDENGVAQSSRPASPTYESLLFKQLSMLTNSPSPDRRCIFLPPYRIHTPILPRYSLL